MILAEFFPILYFKGTRIMMFQLSGFYCRGFRKFKALVRDISERLRVFEM